MGIIILEGSDAVGKDTFAEALAKKTGYEILRGSSFEISELGADGMFNFMMELLDRDNVILNRFFYSNLVYGKLFNYPMMSFAQYNALTDKMDEKALLVYLHASKSIIKYRMSHRGDDMIKVENIDDILNGYKDALYGIYRPSQMLSIDTSETDYKNEIDLITRILN